MVPVVVAEAAETGEQDLARAFLAVIERDGA